ncbi:efflux transporter outer membrane subunit [Dyella sp. C9]|uniref:efflux transporter outer membrane subunit n=1 Tax=Dyella sp. C9 TaxID=2202154 RepID=UPI000DF00732|nr:efflux transporter outer membrane subunit [Dyella sp. C9]
MSTLPFSPLAGRTLGSLACALSIVLAGCAVGPDFMAPKSAAPADWSSWHGGDPSLAAPVDSQAPLQADWWTAFHDPVLDSLEARAFAASPDLEKAALHFAQSRVQRSTVAAQGWPSVNLSAGENRQRISEYSASTRIAKGLGPEETALIDLLSQPFNDYQAGFDASWELDLWGKVRRSIEAADADVAQQAALLDQARLSVASDVARRYFQLRTAQRQIQLTRDDIDALAQRLNLIEVRVNAGVLDHVDLAQQRAELSGLQAQLPGLLAEAGTYENQITLLLGERPGALHEALQPVVDDRRSTLPDLSAGIPSEVAGRRPDIRAAEQQLRSATASIGVAKADLYPSVSIGAQFGYESYLSGEFGDWASRTWSIGPSLNLPLFDHGRRKSVVQLRELQQQEAAVDYHRIVLQAWQEIDDALSGYASYRQATDKLMQRVHSADEAYQLIQVKYDAGTVDMLSLLDSHRTYLQARRDLVSSQGQLDIQFVAVNKAVGNVPDVPAKVADAGP